MNLEKSMLTRNQKKALHHIVRHGDDCNLRTKKWHNIKIELYHMGLLKRRIGDWAWISTQPIVNAIGRTK
jgi:hypothetical protein